MIYIESVAGIDFQVGSCPDKQVQSPVVTGREHLPIARRSSLEQFEDMPPYLPGRNLSGVSCTDDICWSSEVDRGLRTDR